jgi:tRNA dimethylallyltransferase
MLKSKPQKVIIVSGPTASGKTDFAIQKAKELNGELISADSRQIYKYLPITTNIGEVSYSHEIELEINNKTISLPVHKYKEKLIHLIQFVDPKDIFNVYEWKVYAEALIRDINKRGKTPIIVGGTGLYIDALIKNYNISESDEEIDWEQRGRLELLELEELYEILNKLDGKILRSLNESDIKNKRRLIRLIEKGGDRNKKIENRIKKLNFEFEMFYPRYNWEDLKNRIKFRVEKMFDEGIVEEIKNLLAKGYSKSEPGLKIMGASQVIDYLDGKLNLEECKLQIINAHNQYARRQRTWFEGEGRDYRLQVVDYSK